MWCSSSLRPHDDVATAASAGSLILMGRTCALAGNAAGVGRCGMRIEMSRVVRWVLTPVVAILGAAAAQVVVFWLLGTLAYAVLGPAMMAGSTIWAMKAITSVFIGATFVALVWWVAPEGKRRAAVLAFGVVLLWGGTLMAGAFERGFLAWLFAMGAAGVAGGAGALWLGERRLAPRG